MNNVRHLEWRKLVRKHFGTNPQTPLHNLAQNSQFAAQEQAQTVNGGWHFLWASGWLLLLLGGFLETYCSGCNQPAKGPLQSKVYGHNGCVHAQSAKNDPQKNGDGPLNTVA